MLFFSMFHKKNNIIHHSDYKASDIWNHAARIAYQSSCICLFHFLRATLKQCNSATCSLKTYRTNCCAFPTGYRYILVQCIWLLYKYQASVLCLHEKNVGSWRSRSSNDEIHFNIHDLCEMLMDFHFCLFTFNFEWMVKIILCWRGSESFRSF